MSRVQDLPAPLADRLKRIDLIVFDGDCVLCTGFFRFILKHDRQARFRFATAQSPLGQALYTALNLPLNDYETNLVLTGGRIHTHLDAFAAAMAALGWPWRALALCRWLPGPVKRPLYSLIARNRFRLFGRRDTCYLPTPEVRARFMEAP